MKRNNNMLEDTYTEDTKRIINEKIDFFHRLYGFDISDNENTIFIFSILYNR